MVHVEWSIIIRRPIEEVFTYVSDLTHSAEWQAGIIEVQRTTEGPLGIGTKYKFVRKLFGQRAEASNEFIKYEQNRIVTFRITSGPIPAEASYLFEKSGDGTKLTGSIEMHPKGLMRLAEPLITKSLKQEIKPAADKLKSLLETRVPTGLSSKIQ